MDFTEFQKKAGRTRNPELTGREEIFNYAIGLSGETGEVNELVKKQHFHGKQIDKEKYIGEIGDVLWYLANLATVLGIDLGEVAQYNITKLEARYPNGFRKFSETTGQLEFGF